MDGKLSEIALVQRVKIKKKKTNIYYLIRYWLLLLRSLPNSLNVGQSCLLVFIKLKP